MRETPAAPTAEQLAEREGARDEQLDAAVLEDISLVSADARRATVNRDRR
jgi:hypothetical protein